MNLIQIPEDKYQTYLIRMILGVLFLCTFVAYNFSFNTLETILLFFASPTILILMIIIVNPFIIKYFNKEATEQKKIKRKENRILKSMKQSGNRQYKLGPGNKHVVIAANKIKAQSIYKHKIEPLLRTFPNKEFWYATETENNIHEQ